MYRDVKKISYNHLDICIWHQWLYSWPSKSPNTTILLTITPKHHNTADYHTQTPQYCWLSHPNTTTLLTISRVEYLREEMMNYSQTTVTTLTILKQFSLFILFSSQCDSGS